MDVQEEMMNLVQKVWIKLQGLPQASRLELGAFFVLLLFVATFLFLVVLSCVYCCCGKSKYPSYRVEPLQPV